VAGDGCEAVELFEHHHEHIVAVLLDMTMPRMDGREAMRRLRAIDADTPVILMSGYEQPRESRRNGMSPTAFVQKPYRASALVETLQGVLGS
jgi:two-component system cell cycle sensor histidine kinase/response regulator CckA